MTRSSALVISASCTLFAIGLAGCQNSRAESRPPQIVRLSVSPPESAQTSGSWELARRYTAALPHLQFKLVESTGSVDVLDAIQRGDVDLGLAIGGVASAAFFGGLEGHAPMHRLRGLSILGNVVMHLLVRPNSGIQTVADLRGRRVGIGDPTSGTHILARTILGAFELGLGTIRAESLPTHEATAKLMAGALDAVFVDTRYPAPPISMATQAGARLISIEGPRIIQLRRNYPFWRLGAIPRDTYHGQADLIRTVVVDSVLVARHDLEEGLAYELTKHFFEALPALSYADGALSLMDLRQAAATPIPLHEGAARYHRELELFQ